MKVIVLPSKGDIAPSKIQGRVSNGFVDFGRIWDEGWIGTDRRILDFEDVLAEMDIIFCEMTWGDTWQSQMIEFKERHPDKPKVVCFTGSASRFYANVKAEHLPLHVRALEAIDAVGTMNADMVQHYECFGNVKAFHMPCPIDRMFYQDQARKVDRDDGLITLSMHSDLFTNMGGKRCDMVNMFLWKKIKNHFPELRAITWVNSNEHIDVKKRGVEDEVVEDLRTVLKDCGIEVEVRHAGRDFVELAAASFAIVHMNFFHCQSRVSQFGASLGIPVIAPAMNETHRRLFPLLSTQWNRLDVAFDMFVKLRRDRAFYRMVANNAQKRLAYYEAEATKKRILEALF